MKTANTPVKISEEIKFCDICDFPIKPRHKGDKYVCRCKGDGKQPVKNTSKDVIIAEQAKRIAVLKAVLKEISEMEYDFGFPMGVIIELAKDALKEK